MPIRVEAQRNALATRYGVEAPNGALFSADPGTTGAATTELPATPYARKLWNWGAAAASAITSAATVFDVAASTTVAFIGVCVSAVRGTADVRDSFDSVDQTFASAGTYSVTATYTQS